MSASVWFPTNLAFFIFILGNYSAVIHRERWRFAVAMRRLCTPLPEVCEGVWSASDELRGRIGLEAGVFFLSAFFRPRRGRIGRPQACDGSPAEQAGWSILPKLSHHRLTELLEPKRYCN